MPARAILLLTTDVVAQRLVENRLEVPPLLLAPEVPMDFCCTCCAWRYELQFQDDSKLQAQGR